jgi:hypothetical protein
MDVMRSTSDNTMCIVVQSLGATCFDRSKPGGIYGFAGPEHSYIVAGYTPAAGASVNVSVTGTNTSVPLRAHFYVKRLSGVSAIKRADGFLSIPPAEVG